MSVYALAILYTIFVWWFSTGVILYLDGLPRHTFRWSMAAATLLLGWALYGLSATGYDASASGAYLSFSYGLLAWAWQEMGFLMGFMTGPRRTSCPTGCSNWRRARYATEAIAYHELGLITSVLIVFALTWDAPNQVGAWTFFILWAMRLSAKLNVFLGVRNLNAEFLPEHLAYLQSYFSEKAMNALFPISVGVSSVVAFYLWQQAGAAGPDAFQATGFSLLAALLTLAIVEHWLLVLPLPGAALWDWGLRSRSQPPPDRALAATLASANASNQRQPTATS